MSVLDVDRSVLHSSLSGSSSGYFHSTSLSHEHVSEALHRSPDHGATLALSKMNLSDVGVTGAEELATIGRDAPEDESSVERITLGNNRLTTLPTEFALLSRLRYLNLKHNSFSVFPDVLTLMPSLDTLDISHNKIKRLPSQPGQLVHLRVFCFSRNKITRLPSYLVQFVNLEVLQADRNPVEWPPKSVMELSSGLETGYVMKDWIRTVQNWMDAEASRRHDDSGYSEPHVTNNNIQENYESWQFPSRDDDFDVGTTSHARSFSADSNLSVSSIPESLRNMAAHNSVYSQGERPPPLHLEILQSYRTDVSPTRSVESYIPSPTNSDSFEDKAQTGTDQSHDPGPLQQYHARNASYAGGLLNKNHTELREKKSMPELRTAKLSFGKKVPDLPESSSRPTVSSKMKVSDSFSTSLSISQQQDSSSSNSSSSRMAKAVAREASHDLPSVAFERNSYFRRLSKLPMTSALPKPLHCLINSARSILFAVCQVYQTLEHYIVHAVDDRLSSVFRKVLDAASADMLQLINALDRFDATSRKALPPPAVCRGVVESCKDTVAVFGKAVSVLAMQLKVITTGDDVRYSRWILLELYAATAEISCGWQAMAPHIESIKPLLHAKPFTTHSPPETFPISESPIAAPLHLDQPSSLPLPRNISSNSSASGSTTGTISRTRTARRHAGSFSSKDVEIGKQLPSYDDIPVSFSTNPTTRASTLRAPKRQGAVSQPGTSVLISSPSPTSPMPPSTATPMEGFHSNHSRQGSQISLQASSVSSSPSLPSKTTFLELTSNSKTQVDKEALHAVQTAVEIAPIVWDMIEETMGDDLDMRTDVRESLDRARVVTKRLSDIVRAMQVADPTVNRKILREDAHAFLKIVVQLSNIIKTFGGVQSVSSVLRSNMVKLTNSTEEFAILLHVSSFSASTSRSYSPLPGMGVTQANLASVPDDIRLGSNLSRSRSAQPSSSVKLPMPSLHDGPRSALPSQTFKIPVIRRFRGRETHVDVVDPG